MNQTSARPREVCRALLEALEASEGRRRRRKRDQTPDSIGLSIKRELLECAVKEDPAPEAFEQWLVDYCSKDSSMNAPGALRAMARTVSEEWQLAQSLNIFKEWLDRGAPSDDAFDEKRRNPG